MRLSSGAFGLCHDFRLELGHWTCPGTVCLDGLDSVVVVVRFCSGMGKGAPHCTPMGLMRSDRLVPTYRE